MKSKKCINFINKFKKNFKTIFLISFYIFYYFIDSIDKEYRFIRNNMPNVSIVLPVYNKEKYIKRSIGSIQNQTLRNIEIVAVNDFSTDKTLFLLKKLSQKDTRIKIINNDRNHGPLYARGMGIINSTGEYIMCVDPDDRLEGVDNLELLYNKSKTTKADYVKFLIKRIPNTKSEIRIFSIMNKNQLEDEPFLLTNKFIKREIILKAYNTFKKQIFGNSWIYHDDNIWHILIK